MSLSANDNNGSYQRLSPSGKTPPPAPSAAFAKSLRIRDQELQSGALGQMYRPPALRGLTSTGGSPPNDNVAVGPDGGSVLPANNFPPGFRRARAGTLPSNVQLAAQRFAATTPLVDSLDQQPQQQPPSSLSRQPSAVGPPSGLVQPAVRPNLRHSATTAGGVGPTIVPSSVTERNSRLRSGSLTLPSGGLSNAFGSSIFASSWLTNSNGSGAGFSVLDELRSESGAEDFDVHTLDYLGLDDGHRHLPHQQSREVQQQQQQLPFNPPPAATISELRNQAQAAITRNRDRANTVSTYRTRPAPTNSMLSVSAAEEEDEYYMDNYDTLGYEQHLNAYDMQNDYGQSSYLTKAYKPQETLATNRPRAISVGILEDPMRTLGGRRATASDALAFVNELSHPSANNLSTLGNNMGSNPSGILKTDKLAPPRSGVSPSVHFPPNGNEQQLPIGRGASQYLLAPSNQNRSVSPKSEGPSAQLQTPTRSLWIGNLDSAVTSEQLIHVFAPYGAIESLRLLPEKECGFVNFVDQADAIRAKDDVLNRLGGNIGMPNGQTVRIGFGKADSAPVAPAKGNPTSPGNTSPSTAGNRTAGNNTGLSGMDAQLQSTPTRALWIGSIPSSTTPATILSVFSPYGPIESARVLTHKNCGFINFERLDDAVRARKALNGRDVLGSDVGAIRIGFAKVPVKNGQETNGNGEENVNVVPQGVGEMSVGATIHALRGIKGASTIPADQQVLGGAVENYRSNLLLSMIASGMHTAPHSADGAKPPGWSASVTEQQMVMRELAGGSPDAEADIQALAEFRPPTMYYTTIPLVAERTHNRRWDASKLRELRKRLDSGSMSTEEVDQVANDFIDGEIVDLASDWLGNTVVQKLFEKCSAGPRVAMLERICPHLAMIGIHKNGTWAAQKIIECVTIPEEIALIAQHLRAYAPPLLLDQFGNYVVQCCLRFGAPANDFIFDAIVDRMWEVAQGRFGARSMRACLESPHITINQQRRIATAVILNSIPLATNPNGALLLTWLLDTSGFPSRYNLLAPRFTPHLSHLCTHKLASLTVLRIVNQKIEPEASKQIVEALFSSPGDHVLTDVLGDQVNGVAVVHKILTSSFIDPVAKPSYIEATKRVLIELKVIATQAYRRLIEEVGLPVPNFQPTYNNTIPPTGKVTKNSQQNFGVPGLPSGYPSNDQGFASMMAALQMGGQNPQAGPPVASTPAMLQPEPAYSPAPPQQQQRRQMPVNNNNAYSPSSDPFNPFGNVNNSPRSGMQIRRPIPQAPPMGHSNSQYGNQSPLVSHGGPLPGMGMNQPPPQSPYGGMPPQNVPPPHVYQPYMYQPYQQQPPSNVFQ
ncbi:hypothetical protein CVT24_006045 [Panaeolus cyanescens]|uniref:PUM-HD domain-containing protein n=1 Tax=Panaeolus cyanescens TaxID=181874 RepID=A0A409YDZ4_9AGAR|nr:hypothetical protein CVT24_006045 [Panaeolus cyanescens]